MKAISLLILFVILSILPCTFTSAETFKVVFMADWTFAQNPSWLKKIKQWGATGVNLVIDRYEVEDISHNMHWGVIKNALDSINKAGDLDIYIRVSMPFFHEEWFTNDDYYCTPDGKKVYNYNLYNPYTKKLMPMLNLSSPNARKSMAVFLDSTVQFIDKLKYKNKVKLIVPTISPDDETELPTAAVDHDGKQIWPLLTGFSKWEKTEFVNFLRDRYSNDTNKLKESWGKGNKSGDLSGLDFSKIINDLDKYDWAEVNKEQYSYFPAGRKDFMDFRVNELKRFIDTCAQVVKNHFAFGIQLGSVYDEGIEYRGYYDVTPLVENTDCIINDDIPEYYPNFNFSANLLRSVCKFWQNEKHRSKIIFGTETNWIGYNNLNPDTLVKYWKRQADVYFSRGASLLFISHWGTRVQKNMADLFVTGKFDNDGHYSNWRSFLLNLKKEKTDTKLYNNFNTAIHVGLEQTLYSNQESGNYRHRHNDHILTGRVLSDNPSKKVSVMEFPIARFSKPAANLSGSSNADDNKYDILTNYMISHYPDYLKKYKTIILSQTSNYISEKAYQLFKDKYKNKLQFGEKKLRKDEVNKGIIIPGARDEYNNKRSSDQLKIEK